MLPGPPTLFQSILDHPDRSAHDLSTLRLAVTGAAVVPVELIRRMREELTFRTVLTAYGLTEATGTVTMCRAEDDPETIATTSGRAIPDTETRVVDDANQPVAPGTAGRGRHPRLPRDARLPRRPRGHRARPSTPTAGSTPATSG